MTFALNLGYARETLEQGTFTIAIQGQNFRVDNDEFRQAAGVLAGWNTRTASGTDLAANLQYTNLDYTDQPARYRLSDTLRLTAEVGYTHADSNIALFEFNRVTASISVEYGF